MPTPTGISGSRAAAILGLSQYATPFTVWQDIQEQRHGEGWNKAQGYEYVPFQGNAATEFGHAFEDSIVKLTERKYGSVTDRERVFSLGDNITCHVDGIIRKKLFEGKSANHRAYGATWGEPGTDRVPTIYQCQNQHNMLCSGLSEAVMSVLVFPRTTQDWEDEGWKAHHDTLNGVWFLKNHETNQIISPDKWAEPLFEMGFFHNYHIEAKPDTQKILLELYEEFWGRYITGDEVPEAVDYSDIRRQFVAPKGTLVIGEKEAEWFREYKSINSELGAKGYLPKRKEFLKKQILKFAKDQTTVADDESVEKMVFLDEAGGKLGSFAKSGFRVT
jgi:hypothetical protein